MLNHIGRILFLLVFLFAQFVGFSQFKKKEKHPDFGYHIVKAKRMVHFPFKLISNLIVVPVQIGISDTLNFILDTGVSNIIITDPSIAQKYGFQKTRRVQVSGAGQGEILVADISIGHDIKIGGTIGKNQNLVILQKDFLEISQILGMKIHGLIGYDIFNYFVVNIDFSTETIFLYNPDHYKYKPSKGDLFPIDIEDTKPYLNDVEIVANGKTMYSRLMLDTGAGHAVSLELKPNDEIQLPQKTIDAQLGRGLSGTIYGKLGRIDKINIGKYTLNNAIASFPDSLSVQAKLPLTITRNGNIGCDIFRRFSVTFNYREKYMLLKGYNTKLKEPFEHNMSGIEFIAQGDDLDEIIIYKIEKGSPSDLAGFLEGDKVVRVNNKLLREQTLWSINKIIQNNEGREIALLVQRDDRLFFNTFILKREI